MIFENTSLKGSFWQNKINYDILQLSADSRYLWSYVLNNYGLVLMITEYPLPALGKIFEITETQRESSLLVGI